MIRCWSEEKEEAETDTDWSDRLNQRCADKIEKREVSFLCMTKPLVDGFSQVVQRFILRGQPLKIFLK